MLPKAVYWDMDGTLVDSEPLHSRALEAALHSVGIAPPSDLHERVIGQSAIPVYRMMVSEFCLALPFDDWIRRKYAFYLEHVPGLQGRSGAIEIFRDMAKEVHRFTPGAEVAPGIVSIPAYGHTPGHTAFAIHSAGQSLLAMSDTVRNPYLFARHPDWQPLFDMDGPQAVSARRKMLDQAAADRMPVEAYHFPFPACGHVGRTATGYDFVPTEWSPL